MTKLFGSRLIAVGLLTLLVAPAVYAATATINFDEPPASLAGDNCAQPRVPPMFNRPRFAPATSAYIQTPTACDAGSYGVNKGNDSLLQSASGLFKSSPNSNELRWSWVDSTDANAWVRLLTYAASGVTPAKQAPIMCFDAGSTVSMNILVWGVDALGTEVIGGGLEFALVARETGENLPLGYTGSTSGNVTYLGVSGTGGGGTVPDTTTPVGGVLLTTNAAIFYHVVWTIVDSTHVDVSVDDGVNPPVVSNLIVKGFPGTTADDVILASPVNRGILDGLAIRKPVADTGSVQWFVDVDDVIISAPGLDPVMVQSPLSQLREKVWVTNIDPTATAVTLYANGLMISTATAPPTDFSSRAYQFTGLTLHKTEVITATQTVGGVESAASTGVTVTQWEVIEDFTAGVKGTGTAASWATPPGPEFDTWYAIGAQTYGTRSANTMAGSGACLRYEDGGYMNGAYAIYDNVVPSTKTNYVVTAKVQLNEGTVTNSMQSLEFGAQPNGVHRDITSSATPGSTGYACHLQSLKAIAANPLGGYASFAGMNSGDNSGTQVLTTGGMFSAAEGDNILVAFSTNVHTKWSEMPLFTSGANLGMLDNLDSCEIGEMGLTPVRNDQGTWNVKPNAGGWGRVDTLQGWGGGGYIQIDDIHLDLFDMCATVPTVTIGSILVSGQTTVVVSGCTAGATINVYKSVSTLICTFTPAVAGNNTVTLTEALVAGGKISATQTVGGIEGCIAAAPQVTVDDCGQVGAALTMTGPLNEGATSITVNGVSSSASLIEVFDGATLIGSKSSGITAGDNAIAVTALVKDHAIQAQQTRGGLRGCTGISQVVGSGHNSSVRLSLGVREVTGLTGPVGANGYNDNSPIEWIIPIDTGDATSGLKTGAAPIGHKIVPSPNWETVTFDPVTTGAANVVSFNLGDGILANPWVTIEHLAITMDQAAKDVGPYKMYIDNVKNGTAIVQDFNTTTGGVMFKTPGAAGSTGTFLASTPSVATTDANVRDSDDTTGRSDRIEWRWNQLGSPTQFMWVRLTTDNSSTAKYPGGSPEIQTTAATTMRVYLPCPSPRIDVQPTPASQTLTPGSSVTYSVTATSISGNPLSYQWYKGTTALVDGGSITGATTVSLTINPLVEADAGTYKVRVIDACGYTDSINLTLGVCAPVAITGQPTAQSTTLGGAAAFSVTATGSGTLAYQWRMNGTNLVDGTLPSGTVVAGATTPTLNLTSVALAENGATFDVVVTGCNASTATSTAAALTVSCTGVTITGQPANQSGAPGMTATFTVAASGQAPLSYQWQKNGVNLADGGNVSGATTVTLTITNAQIADNGSYRCVVTNPCGSVNSNAATLTVSSNVTITAWRSLKTHSGYGELAITLNAAAIATGQGIGGIKVESRNSAAQNGLTKIQVDFSGPVTLGNPAAVTITGLVTTGCNSAGTGCVSAPKTVTAPTVTILPSGTTMQLAFTNGSAAGDTCYLITIGAGAVTQTITGDNNCKVRMLQSDSSGDGLISVADMSQIKTRFNQPVTTLNCVSDQNLAAGINVADMSQAKTRYGRRALCP